MLSDFTALVPVRYKPSYGNVYTESRHTLVSPIASILPIHTEFAEIEINTKSPKCTKGRKHLHSKCSWSHPRQFS